MKSMRMRIKVASVDSKNNSIKKQCVISARKVTQLKNSGTTVICRTDATEEFVHLYFTNK